ncbi:hypothetical protein MKW92_053942 [Papaver armeniacum]|nr:hypothetical protein MKW92_053942 [Papaver armeniacum]
MKGIMWYVKRFGLYQLFGFLTLKNANVFLQQGPSRYQNALHCYLQAVEIDNTRLLFRTNWENYHHVERLREGFAAAPTIGMEKLMKVPTVICDEVACLRDGHHILALCTSKYHRGIRANFLCTDRRNHGSHTPCG